MNKTWLCLLWKICRFSFEKCQLSSYWHFVCFGQWNFCHIFSAFSNQSKSKILCLFTSEQWHTTHNVGVCRWWQLEQLLLLSWIDFRIGHSKAKFVAEDENINSAFSEILFVNVSHHSQPWHLILWIEMLPKICWFPSPPSHGRRAAGIALLCITSKENTQKSTKIKIIIYIYISPHHSISYNYVLPTTWSYTKMNPPKKFSAILAGSLWQDKSAQPAWVKV